MDEPNSTVQPARSRRYWWIFLAVFLGVCLFIIGLTGCFGLSFWGWNAIQKAIVPFQTQVAYAVQATTTHVALAQDRANFTFLERFNDNSNEWTSGSYDNEYYKGESKIEDGLYIWDFTETLKPFFTIAAIESKPMNVYDFDAYVDGIRREGDAARVCYGILFRYNQTESSDTFYTFYLCDIGYYSLYFYEGETDKWYDLISQQDTRSRQYSQAIRAGEWNTLGVMARGSHLKFLINDWTVQELNDTHLEAGGIYLYVEAGGSQPASISFDNFAVQVR